MPLYLYGTVHKVTNGGIDQLNKETGVITKTDPSAYIIHEADDSTESAVKVEKLKLKDNLQAEAFRRLIGRDISVPVNVWAANSGGDFGFWLGKGVLPTPTSPKPKSETATAAKPEKPF